MWQPWVWASATEGYVIDNKIKVTVRMGCGYGNIHSLAASHMFRCSDVQPEFLGRRGGALEAAA